jgi:hypothetical protein
MSWVRRRRRFGGYLALAGLVLQLALSFGHVHLGDINGNARSVIVWANAPASPSSPAKHPSNDADDYCAICATMHLASTSLLPDAPLLPPPFGLQSVEHFNHVAIIFVAPRRTPFQSRAPPLA